MGQAALKAGHWLLGFQLVRRRLGLLGHERQLLSAAQPAKPQLLPPLWPPPAQLFTLC